MIETDKMLQLRRYVTLLRAGAKSRVVRSHPSTSTSTSRQVSSYISRYLHRDTCPSRLQTHLRSPANSYTATCIIRTLGTTVPQSSVDDVEHKLVSFCDDVKKGRVSAYGLKEVIRLCNEIDYQLPHDTGVLLLSCCGSLLADLETSERQHLADQVWHLAKKNSEGLTLEYYNTLLNVHMENSISVDPKEFLADMREVKPDKNTYRLLLNVVAKMGNSNHLRDVTSLMKEKNVIVDEDMFNTLVQIYATNGNIAQAEHVITLMRDANLSMDKAYTELACGYAKLGDIPNLVKILNDEPQSDTNLLKLIKVLSISDNGRHIPVVLNFLMTSTPALKSQISNTIAELTRLSRATDAHTIINCLAMNDTTKDIARGFVNSFLNDLVMLNASVDDITKYAADFVDSGCEPLALTNVAESSLKLSRENLSLAVFKMMREKGLELRPHYYWPLLVIAHHSKGEAKIFSLVKLMMDTGVALDSDTLINYVYPYVNTASPITVLQKLMIIGVPSSIIYTPLISFLLSRKRMQEIKSFCTSNKQFKINYKELIRPLVRAYIATKNVDTCVSLLMVFSQGEGFVALFLKLLLLDRHLTLAEKNLELFLTEFEKRGARISKRDATVLKNILNEKFNVTEDNRSILKLMDKLVDPNKRESLLSLITHPKLMSTDELACLLVEQKSKNLETRNALRQLLEAYCTENNLRKAEEVKREFDACQYKWSAAMKVYLFELYVRNNKLKEAETLLSDLQTMFDNFQIDNVKLVMFATALVKANKPKRAFEVITNSNVNLKTDAQKFCHTLLLAFAQSRYHSQTKDMLNLLVEKGYCNITTELLRPLVAIPLEHNDIEGAVNTFIACVDKYKKTPLALEIFTALLQHKDNSKLPNAEMYIKKMYDILITLYGIESANTMLVLALATLGRIQELQTILQTQTISTNNLMNYFNYARRNNNVDSLLNLFKAISDSNDFNQFLLSEMLLSIYNKMGDYENAIELWKLMCAKNLTPSEKFKNTFIQFLHANKVPLPPEFEQERNETTNVSDQKI